MKTVLRPGHIAIRVMDLGAAITHYVKVLGMVETARDEQGRVFLKAWDEHDHHSLVLREADAPGMDYMAFKVEDETTLHDLAKAITEFGLDVEWVSAGEHPFTGERLRFTAPTGHVFELYAHKGLYGNGMPTTNPGIRADDLKGIHPSRFDHCALIGDDVEGSYRLFTEVLGFDLTEQVVDGDEKRAVFLSCSTKPHDVAFIQGPVKGKLHHMSFFVDSWAQVLDAADIIASNDVPHEVGPTRHGITRGETLYFFDPSGNRNEVFSGGYIWYPDRPTLTWTVDEMPKALFFTERKLNETFLTVVT
ncbi:catechol 2,3-dioxygenase [Oceanisphaera litoralis]|uniref:catechol 2,3-dioxygenase n=1 Tax=Oceanisphaera litoralis TaxID=225144 RepID=UPI00195EBE2C|nr:catechol 2,3-dioxygenase [Oceanisphaera litoralis]